MHTAAPRLYVYINVCIEKAAAASSLSLSCCSAAAARVHFQSPPAPPMFRDKNSCALEFLLHTCIEIKCALGLEFSRRTALINAAENYHFG
jgi:hypothetical protein